MLRKVPKSMRTSGAAWVGVEGVRFMIARKHSKYRVLDNSACLWY